jgi:hypothetical protein
VAYVQDGGRFTRRRVHCAAISHGGGLPALGVFLEASDPDAAKHAWWAAKSSQLRLRRTASVGNAGSDLEEG